MLKLEPGVVAYDTWTSAAGADVSLLPPNSSAIRVR